MIFLRQWNFFQSQLDDWNFLKEITNWEHLLTPNSRRRWRRFSWKIGRVSSSTTSRLTSGCRWIGKWFLFYVRKLHIPPSRRTQSQILLTERRIIQFHWKTLTSPQLQERIWILCKSAASMIIGISMDQEICLFLGQVSLSLETSRRKNVVGGETDRTAGCHPGQIIYGRNSGSKWKKC